MNVPHTRGDEPILGELAEGVVNMFPTHVGMNRFILIWTMTVVNVPHTRGDEPKFTLR